VSTTTAAVRISAVKTERLFYLIAALAMVGGVALGFHMFYLHGTNDVGLPVTKQSAPLVYLHGGLMTCWMVLFLAQCGLVVAGNRRLHMQLGAGALALYLLIVPVGAIAAILQIRYVAPHSFLPFGPYRFLILPLTEIANFAMFVGAAFLLRRRPQWHRPLMTIGTLSAAQAGIGRIAVIRGAFSHLSHAAFFPTFWGSTVVVLLLLWILKLAMTRRFDRHFAICVALFVASGLLSSYVSTTAWWIHAAQVITR